MDVREMSLDQSVGGSLLGPGAVNQLGENVLWPLVERFKTQVRVSLSDVRAPCLSRMLAERGKLRDSGKRG